MQAAAVDIARATRVLVVDDDHARAELLQKWIGEFPEYDWVGHHATRNGLKPLARRLRPDIVVLDLTLPEDEFSDPDHDCGRRCAGDLRDVAPDTRILIVTTNAAAQGPEVVRSTGAEGLLLDVSIRGADRVQRFRHALDGVRDGFRSLDTRAADLADLADRCGLEPRHLDLMPWLFYAVPSKQIAAKRGYSEKTMETYRSHIIQRVSHGLAKDCSNATEAAVAFYRELAITPEDPR